MIFPVILKTQPDAKPPARIYYEVASNGVFHVKDTEIYHAVTRAAGEIPGLHAERERVILKFPPLPTRLLEEVKNVSEVARIVGIDRRTLQRKMVAWGLRDSDG